MSISVELTAIIVLAVTSIFWLAGLSFGTNRNTEDIKGMREELKKFANSEDLKTLRERSEKDVDILHSKHNDLSVELRKDMGEVKLALGRIEERLTHHNKE